MFSPFTKHSKTKKINLEYLLSRDLEYRISVEMTPNTDNELWGSRSPAGPLTAALSWESTSCSEHPPVTAFWRTRFQAVLLHYRKDEQQREALLILKDKWSF